MKNVQIYDLFDKLATTYFTSYSTICIWINSASTKLPYFLPTLCGYNVPVRRFFEIIGLLIATD